MGINWVITQLSSREGCGNSDEHYRIYGNAVKENAEKAVQDTSCLGSGCVPQLHKPPKIGGYMGLIETISAVS
jgi:hypothetical protein